MAMKGGTGGLEVLAMFLVIFGLQAVGFVIGVWAYRAQPAMRRAARWLLGLPLVFYFLPDLVMAVAGGELSDAGLAAIVLFLLAVVLGACVVMPRKVASALPAFLFQSKFFNALILVLVLLGWLFAIGVLVWLFGIEAEALRSSLARFTCLALAVGRCWLRPGPGWASGVASMVPAENSMWHKCWLRLRAC